MSSVLARRRMKVPMPLIIERVLNNSRAILARQLLITGGFHRCLRVHFLPPPTATLKASSLQLKEKQPCALAWLGGGGVRFLDRARCLVERCVFVYGCAANVLVAHPH